MMSSNLNVFDFNPISEYFNRLLCMHIQSIALAYLPILVKADPVQFPTLCQKQAVELPSVDRSHSFIEVTVQLFSRLVLIENLSLLRKSVKKSAKLVPVVLSDAEDPPVFCQVQSMLKA